MCQDVAWMEEVEGSSVLGENFGGCVRSVVINIDFFSSYAKSPIRCDPDKGIAMIRPPCREQKVSLGNQVRDGDSLQLRPGCVKLDNHLLNRGGIEAGYSQMRVQLAPGWIAGGFWVHNPHIDPSWHCPLWVAWEKYGSCLRRNPLSCPQNYQLEVSKRFPGVIDWRVIQNPSKFALPFRRLFREVLEGLSQEIPKVRKKIVVTHLPYTKTPKVLEVALLIVSGKVGMVLLEAEGEGDTILVPKFLRNVHRFIGSLGRLVPGP